jgi:hypothetical protein
VKLVEAHPRETALHASLPHPSSRSTPARSSPLLAWMQEDPSIRVPIPPGRHTVFPCRTLVWKPPRQPDASFCVQGSNLRHILKPVSPPHSGDDGNNAEETGFPGLSRCGNETVLRISDQAPVTPAISDQNNEYRGFLVFHLHWVRTSSENPC